MNIKQDLFIKRIKAYFLLIDGKSSGQIQKELHTSAVKIREWFPNYFKRYREKLLTDKINAYFALIQGLNGAQIKKKYHISPEKVRYTFPELYERNRGNSRPLTDEQKLIIKEGRKQHKTIEQIAQDAGTKRHNVETYIKREGLQYTEDELTQIQQKQARELLLSIDEIAQHVSENSKGQYIYYGGYKRNGGEFYIEIQCTTCGAVKKINSSTCRAWKSKTKINCSNCQKIATREKNEKAKAKRKEASEKQKQIKRLINALNKIIKDKEAKQPRACVICNKLFTPKNKNNICCSSECSKKNGSQRRNRRKDNRLNDNNIIDRDINLKALYKRDKGRCYICGRQCSWEDSEWRHGVFYAGLSYPSIDHVQPLAKGGKHSWSNVKLACMICNSIKSDTTADKDQKAREGYAPTS